MNLIIFDVDGTLTDTVNADNRCLVKAYTEQWGRKVRPDWQNYKYTTDSGVGREIYKEIHGTYPDREQMHELKEKFMIAIRKAIAESPDEFREVPGSADAFRFIKDQPDWKVAVATGSWTDSAILKQKQINIDFRDIAFATADDSYDRPDILKIGIMRAQLLYRIRSFDRIVYVGDSPWDVDAARQIQIAFVGRGKGKAARLLEDHGADQIIPDFLNHDEFLRILNAANIPSRK